MNTSSDGAEYTQNNGTLREVDSHFRSMFERSQALMLLIEPEGGAIVDANEAASSFYGYPINTMRQMHIEEINMLPPEQVAQERRRALVEERNYFIFPHRLASGAIRTVEVLSTPMVVNDKTLLFSIIHDISERLRAEEALHKSEVFLKQTQSIAHVGGWEYEVATQKVIWTDEVYRIYGVGKDYDPSDIRRAIAFYAPQEQAIIDRAFRRVVAQGEAYDLEMQFISATGKRKWVRTIGQAERISGKIVRVFGTILDITARKRVEEALRASRARYRTLFELESDAILLIDSVSGEILEANTMATRTYGYSHDELLLLQITDLSTQPDETQRSIKEKHTTIPMRYHRKKDGTVFPVEITANYLVWAGRECKIAAIRDITQRVRSEESEREHRTLAEALRDTAAALNSTLTLDEVLDRILDNVGRVVPHDAANIMLVNADAYTVSVVRSRGYVEHGEEDIVSLQFQVAMIPGLSQMMHTGCSLSIPDTRANPTWVEHPATRWVASYASAPIRIRDRTLGFLNVDSGRAGFFHDGHAERLMAFADQAAIAIENARLYAEVQALAITDPLTGLFNRRGLFHLGEREVERALRFHKPLAIVMIDLDHFKHINDTYGHPIGDRVLHTVAMCCRAELRNVDVIARYGGEEFVALLPETDLANAMQVSERLRQSVEVMTVPDSLEQRVFITSIHVTVSLGIAMLTPDTPNLAAIIVRADQALYAAKQAGRNRVVVSE
ncbi:MAG: diguanylate cyclase [Chloroflexales bacterium]